MERLRPLCELIETERSYIHDLEVLLRFKECLQYAPEEEAQSVYSKCQTLFSSLSTIYTLNSNMLKRLERRVEKSKSSGSMPRVGDILSAYAPLFEIYSEYAKEHANASYVINGELKKPFYEKHAHLRGDSTFTEMTINAALISPIQRVPRYLLIVNEIIKIMDHELLANGSNVANSKKADVEERSKLEEALGGFRESASTMNSQIAEKENWEKLVNISRSLSGCSFVIVTKGRQFIKEGYITKLKSEFAHGNYGARNKYMFFLFNDCIIYASDQIKGYKLHRVLPLQGSICFPLPKIGDVEFPFALIIKDKTSILASPSSIERDFWIQSISKQAQGGVHASPPSLTSLDLEEVQKCISGAARINIPSRSLHFHGLCLNVTSCQMQDLFLFSDILLLGLTTGILTCSMKATYPLYNLKVADVVYDEREPRMFAVNIHTKGSNSSKKEEIIVVSFRSMQDKTSFLEATKSLIQMLPLEPLSIAGGSMDTAASHKSLIGTTSTTPPRSPSSSHGAPPRSPTASLANTHRSAFQKVMDQILSFKNVTRTGSRSPTNKVARMNDGPTSPRATQSRRGFGSDGSPDGEDPAGEVKEEGETFEGLSIGRPKLISVLGKKHRLDGSLIEQVPIDVIQTTLKSPGTSPAPPKLHLPLTPKPLKKTVSGATSTTPRGGDVPDTVAKDKTPPPLPLRQKYAAPRGSERVIS